jgi:dihydroflavonol-4-reductase
MTFKPPKQILVTGGAGFIGSQVVRILRARYPNAAIRVLHLPRENLLNLQEVDGIELMAGDITQAAEVQKAVTGCDVVFHLAAIYAFWLPDMSLMHKVNVEGTRLLFEECKKQKVRRVVYTSSAVCFAGHGLDIVCTEESTFNMDFMVYAKSKHDSHRLAEYYAANGLDVVIVAPAMPIGPGDVGPTPTGRTVTEIFHFPLPVALKTEMNLIDVRDCAMGHVLALEKGATGESYLLGGENYRHADVLRRVLRFCGMHRTVRELPSSLFMPMAKIMVMHANRTGKPPMITPTEVKLANQGLVLDAGKARRELGLTVRPLEESLRDAVAWFFEHGYIASKAAETHFARQWAG